MINPNKNNHKSDPLAMLEDMITMYRQEKEEAIKKITQIIGQKCNVAIYDSWKVPSLSFYLFQKCKAEFPDWITLPINLKKSKCFNEFIGAILQTILSALCPERGGLKRYLSEYFWAYKPELITPIKLWVELGDNPVKTAEEILKIVEEICCKKDKRIILLFDNVEYIRLLTQYEDVISFLQKRISEKSNIGMVTLTWSKFLHEAITEGVEPSCCRQMVFTNLAKLEDKAVAGAGSTNRWWREFFPASIKLLLESTPNDQSFLKEGYYEYDCDPFKNLNNPL